jgi:hypothetical protein
MAISKGGNLQGLSMPRFGSLVMLNVVAAVHLVAMVWSSVMFSTTKISMQHDSIDAVRSIIRRRAIRWI